MSPSFLLPLQALITNDAVVLGLLASALGLVFYTHSLPQFKRFYTFVPALLMCYFIPAALNSLGVVNGEESNLYFVASRYLLPASLILLCLSIDLKGIYNLGPKAIVMFFAATAGIIVGGPLALWLVSQSDAGVLGGDAPDAYWRGLSTVAGSWIGGGANQAALKEISGTLDDQFSIMLIVDVFVANLWMPFLLFGAGIREKIDGWLKADASAVNELQDKVEQLQSKSARIASFPDWMVIVALAFGGVAVSHLVADNASVSSGPLARGHHGPKSRFTRHLFVLRHQGVFLACGHGNGHWHWIELHPCAHLRRSRRKQNGLCVPLHPCGHHWNENGHRKPH